MNEVRSVFVDRTVIRMARLARGDSMFQFCPRCQRLVMRAGGCNHIACLCGNNFCIICAGDWPVGAAEATQPLCHPFFGAENEHVLRIPPRSRPVWTRRRASRPPRFLTRLPRASSVATSPIYFTR
ncbi:hypothetical protein B0I37DRAFT_410323 [Chaetomium sp. MPI-CAGE-AT-0009]|nr:hypothetical protein B0I37DRAFT_410323 [Chaetomium sp. MPI-CAGE-AT-0009]